MKPSRFDKLLNCPEEQREALLSLFAASMQFIHERRPEWCLVHLVGRKIRLFAGRLIVLSLENDRVWLATDVAQEVPEAVERWSWDLNDYPEYKRPASRNGYFVPVGDWVSDWMQVAVSHFAYLERALATGSAPDHRSVVKHDAALAELIFTSWVDLPRPSVDQPGSDALLVLRDQADMRTRVQRSTVVRPGQREFRQAVLAAYGGRCAISGCDVEKVLEAAHICRYNGVQTDLVSNGLLLRSDLHKLMDEHLLTVSASTMRVRLASALKNSSYAEYEGRPILLPASPKDRPAREYLAIREGRFDEKAPDRGS